MATAATANHTRTARLFHALSDEVRLEIIDLIGDGEHCVCEITSALDIAQSRLSFHLKVLKEAGLVTDRRDGRWVYYTLSREAFDECADVLAQLRPRSRRAAATACCS